MDARLSLQCAPLERERPVGDLAVDGVHRAAPSCRTSQRFPPTHPSSIVFPGLDPRLPQWDSPRRPHQAGRPVRLSTRAERERSHLTVETSSEERAGEAPSEPRTVILIPLRRIGVAVADL